MEEVIKLCNKVSLQGDAQAVGNTLEKVVEARDLECVLEGAGGSGCRKTIDKKDED